MSKKKTDQELREIALKYTNYKDFIEKEQSVRVIARKRGILYDISSHMERPRIKNLTVEVIREKALLCTNRAEFKNEYPSEYKAARRMGVLDEICHYMKPQYISWTDKMLINEAKKYNNRRDFQINSKAAYEATKRRGQEFLDTVCSHMFKPKISSPEKAILDAVRKYFPDAQKFRATKLNIPGKTYIKSLEADILVKSLGKAIEYDSDHFHSLEGLKRGHPTWPEEDIKIYHKIKDSVFKDMGIEILHIKQDEWKKDKETCIQKCLSFLNINEQKAA